MTMSSLAVASAQDDALPEEGAADVPSGPEPATVDLDEAEARALFDAGVLAFHNARYEDALERFQRAYELAPHPQLLYNVAITADRLRRDTEAIDAFERFLATDPPENLRLEVERRLAILRAASSRPTPEPDPEREPEPAPTPGPAPTPEPTSSGPGAGPFVLGGVGLAVAIAGGVLLGLAADASSAVTNAPDGARWDDLRDRAESGPIFEVVGAIGLGVGLAVVAAAIGWLVAGSGDDDTVAIGPNGVGVRW